ncbi:glycosyltransferase family 2 protein [Epilithonimonas arachidiradicis]|uniref:Glycosyl transferase n=1 Tax=Epilithonimonas arachidiradicis TaxID=1617282 RepID=A0A420DBP6_9FLAO|nr:glycosyltransferase family 2 protein [Epilithonimonas arachidiradicis]RKE89008.1 rhamnosyltransferase [Epilithonimonas arachidiradicis]GGG53294.1 glycosyl transferase [Epilithonimonas arachidiradicis]
MIYKVAILLSTYNGEKYLENQLKSVINQSFFNWTLFIRDDGSTDSTKTIITKYAEKYGNIIIVESDTNFGSALSFMKMVEMINAEYYMFCDQDDQWDDNKIAISLEKIKELEGNLHTPSLVFSDLKVVDENLNVIDNSFWNYNKVLPELLIKNPDFINVFNCAPGCTMIFNRSLRDLSLDYDQSILMHDWYIIIKALQMGKVDYIKKPLILYRQHLNNVVGADKVSLSKLIRKIFHIRKTIKSQLKTFFFVKKYTKINLLKYYLLKSRFNSARLK